MNHIEQMLTSVEVAEMVGKEHKNLIRDIRSYTKQLGELKIEQSSFFEESTYVNSQNKQMPCYNITKKGCEFIAHKMTGVKGTEFTARYINRFHEMEEQLQRENHTDWFVNDVRVFQHREFGILRAVKLDGKDYFIGKDVTIALGYVNNTDTLKKRVSNSEKCYISICDGNRSRRMVAITKKGLAELIKTGKLPLAGKYDNWIKNQVLPTLSGKEIIPVKTGTEQLPDIVPEVDESKPVVLELIQKMSGFTKVKGLSIIFNDDGNVTGMKVDEITN